MSAAGTSKGTRDGVIRGEASAPAVSRWPCWACGLPVVAAVEGQLASAPVTAADQAASGTRAPRCRSLPTGRGARLRRRAPLGPHLPTGRILDCQPTGRRVVFGCSRGLAAVPVGPGAVGVALLVPQVVVGADAFDDEVPWVGVVVRAQADGLRAGVDALAVKRRPPRSLPQ